MEVRRAWAVGAPPNLCKMSKNLNPKAEVSRQKTEKEKGDREVMGWG